MEKEESHPVVGSSVSASRCLVVFSKPSRPGAVKTRLIGMLTPQQACDLHEAFLGDLVERLKEGDFHLEVAWAVSRESKAPDIGLPAMTQIGETLGDRLFDALSRVAKEFEMVAAIGSDHPDLPLSQVQGAFEQLESGADIVLGPAKDGGYYLIAVHCRNLDRDLFSRIEWSSSTVLSDTLNRCRTIGLEVSLLDLAADVDLPRDLERLARTLAEDPNIHCPRTRQVLADWNMG